VYCQNFVYFFDSVTVEEDPLCTTENLKIGFMNEGAVFDDFDRDGKTGYEWIVSFISKVTII
jgi:hypothetical protein